LLIESRNVAVKEFDFLSESVRIHDRICRMLLRVRIPSTNASTSAHLWRRPVCRTNANEMH